MPATMPPRVPLTASPTASSGSRWDWRHLRICATIYTGLLKREKQVGNQPHKKTSRPADRTGWLRQGVAQLLVHFFLILPQRVMWHACPIVVALHNRRR